MADNTASAAPEPVTTTSEPPTGQIADRVSQAVGCHCIIATVSRKVADLNRSPEHEEREGRNPQAIYEYRNTIRRILESADLLENGNLKHPFLQLQIHGMQDRSLDPSHWYDLDVEVGTRGKTTCSPAAHQWIVSKFEDWVDTIEGRKEVVVGANQLFSGNPSKKYHRHGTADYQGYGNNFHTVQIEFTRWLRSEHRTEIEDVLKQIAVEFGEADTEPWIEPSE